MTDTSDLDHLSTTTEESDVLEMAAEVELVEAEVVHIMHNLRQAGTRTHTARKRKRNPYPLL